MSNKANQLNNNYDKIIVVDPGKNEVKTMVFDKDFTLKNYFSFPSKTEKKRNFYDIDSSGDNQYKTIYEGQNYLVGEGIRKSYNFETTKNNLHHKICVYTAIAIAVEKPNERIHLVVGYPSSDFVNIEQRTAYMNLLSSKKVVNFTVDEEEKTFEIVDVSVYPEGIAMRPRVLNAKRPVHIVDIGGQNVNYREYDVKGNTLQSLSLDDAGVNHLENFIKTRLRKFVNADIVSIDALDIMDAIKTGKIEELDDSLLSNYSNSKEFMEDTIANFIEDSILGQLLSRGINLYQRGHLIIFVGGGSVLLKPYLEETLVNNKGNLYFSDTARWDNCISYIMKDIGDRCKKEGFKEDAQVFAQIIFKETSSLK